MSDLFGFFKRGPGVDVDAMMERARGLIDSGSREQACEVLEQLVITKPEFGPAWHWLGATLLHTGNLVRAREALENAKRLSPQNKEIDKSICMLQHIEGLAATAKRSGGSLMVAGKTAEVGESVNHRIREFEKAERDQATPICRICMRRCRILADQSIDSEVGFRCGKCSVFYCASCVKNIFQYTDAVDCLGCKESRVHRPAAGSEPLCEGFKTVHYRRE